MFACEQFRPPQTLGESRNRTLLNGDMEEGTESTHTLTSSLSAACAMSHIPPRWALQPSDVR